MEILKMSGAMEQGAWSLSHLSVQKVAVLLFPMVILVAAEKSSFSFLLALMGM
jgi:hypothetical protein